MHISLLKMVVICGKELMESPIRMTKKYFQFWWTDPLDS